MTAFLRRLIPYWPYGLLALAVTFPLLKPGYVLTVDMVFVPRMPAPTAFSNDYLFFGLLHVLSYVVPAMLLQKIILLSIFLAAGAGAHRLLALTRPPLIKPLDWRWGCYFAGLFYACNPFVYTRLLAGQYTLLLGYALLPWLTAAIWRFCRRPDRPEALRAAGFILVVSVISLHMLGLGVMIAALFVGGYAWHRRKRRVWLHSMLRQGALASVLALVASSYWLIPLLTSHNHTADVIAGFGAGDLQAFQTVPGTLGLVGNVLALQGFWGDDRNLYQLPQDSYAWWLAPLIALWLLVGVGLLWSWRHQRRIGGLFAGTLLLGVILGVGTAGTLFAPFNQLLVDHAPFFSGYREPQKFAALIALSYAYFGGVGFVWLRQRLGVISRQQLAAVLLLLPLACAPYLPWGGAGQLRAADYPPDWYQLNGRLQEVMDGPDKILFLPWHLYMPFPFSNGVVANPAPKFFAVPLIASNDPELGQATGYAAGSTVRAVDQLLPTAPHRADLAVQLARLHIRYIIVSKTFDYRAYDYLGHTAGIQVFSQTPSLIVYHVNPKEAL